MVMETLKQTSRLDNLYSLEANRTKSAIFATSAEGEVAFSQLPNELGLVVVPAFKDLGVAQGRRRDAEAIQAKRYESMQERAGRIGILP